MIAANIRSSSETFLILALAYRRLGFTAEGLRDIA